MKDLPRLWASVVIRTSNMKIKLPNEKRNDAFRRVAAVHGKKIDITKMIISTTTATRISMIFIVLSKTINIIERISMSFQVNFVVLFVAIKIVVRRATYKVKPAERGVMSDLQVEIRYESLSHLPLRPHLLYLRLQVDGVLVDLNFQHACFYNWKLIQFSSLSKSYSKSYYT